MMEFVTTMEFVTGAAVGVAFTEVMENHLRGLFTARKPKDASND